MLCDRKKIDIIEAELCVDHVHVLIKIPPKDSVAGIIGYLKGKSTLQIFDCYAQMKYKYGHCQFCCNILQINQKKIKCKMI